MEFERMLIRLIPWNPVTFHIFAPPTHKGILFQPHNAPTEEWFGLLLLPFDHDHGVQKLILPLPFSKSIQFIYFLLKKKKTQVSVGPSDGPLLWVHENIFIIIVIEKLNHLSTTMLHRWSGLFFTWLALRTTCNGSNVSFCFIWSTLDQRFSEFQKVVSGERGFIYAVWSAVHYDGPTPTPMVHTYILSKYIFMLGCSLLIVGNSIFE